MDRSQFMQQLERLLSDISAAERQEALDYYENYFEDAGAENEAAVIRELGSPGKVAAIIKADLSESSEEYAEYTERGYEDTRNREFTQVPDKYTQVSAERSGSQAEDDAGSREGAYAGTAGRTGNSYTGSTGSTGESGSSYTGNVGRTGSRYTGTAGRTGSSYAGSTGGTGESGSSYTGNAGETGSRHTENTDNKKFGRARAGADSREYSRNTDRAQRGYHAEKKRNKPGIILILILLVFLSPFIKGAAGGVLGLVVTIALLPFFIILGLAAGVFGLLVGGIACVATGIALCFTSLGAGLLAAGVGCLLLAVGAVFLVLLLWAAFKLLPKLLRKFTDFCSHILHKRGKDGAAE